jgi:hypothetical protein
MKKTLVVTSVIQGIYCLLSMLSMVLLGVYHFGYGEPYAEPCFRVGAILFAGTVFGLLIPIACEVVNTIIFFVRLKRMTLRQIIVSACMILGWTGLLVLLLLVSIVVFVSVTGGV